MVVMTDQATELTHSGVGIDEVLAASRAGLPRRVGPEELEAIRAAGGLVIDTRPVAQRERDGELEGSIVEERNVLEWRLDPTSPNRLPEVTGPDQVIVVACDEGYASSLAAESLQRIGLRNATDLAGGHQAWLAFVGRT